MSKKVYSWPSISAELQAGGLATSAKQDEQTALLTTIDASVASIDSNVIKADTDNVTVVSSVLPTGAATEVTLAAAKADLDTIAAKDFATSAKQDTGNTSLSSIDTKLSSQATAANQTTANTSLSSIDTKLSSQATAANQTTANTSLSSIDTKLSSQATAANQSTANTSLSSIDTKLSSQATATKQDTGNTSLASIDSKTPALGQALAAASVPVVLTAAQISTLTPLSTVAATQSGTWTVQPGNTANTTAWLVKLGGKTAAGKARNDYSSVNVTTSAYVQLIASTASACTEIEIFDSSGQTLLLATGAAASEVDQIYIVPGGNGRIPLSIASGTRISIKAVSATASSGEITINLYS